MCPDSQASRCPLAPGLLRSKDGRGTASHLHACFHFLRSPQCSSSEEAFGGVSARTGGPKAGEWSSPDPLTCTLGATGTQPSPEVVPQPPGSLAEAEPAER